VMMGPIRCLETSVNNYHTTPRNTPEDRRFVYCSVLMLSAFEVVFSFHDVFILLMGLYFLFLFFYICFDRISSRWLFTYAFVVVVFVVVMLAIY
jgi:hypothetical protein